MSQLPEIHLCIQQPVGYVHSLGLLDQARYFRYQAQRLGATVSLAKNRLRHDALNFVFGAHLGFDAAQRERHACIFVNLEQLGEGGAKVSADYLKLLASSAVVDYDADNRAAYATSIDDVPVVPLLHAPYLTPTETIPLEDRPIDLLFIGSMNERRRAWLDRIEATGLSVAMFDSALYGPERDQFILQAKAVVNAHFYESSRFEQARVAHCLSLGTPVISERTAQTLPHPAFEDSVFWLEGEQLEQFFTQDFGTPDFFAVAREALQRFEHADPIEAYADLLAFGTAFTAAHHERRPTQAWLPQRINLGSGKDYQSGWLNLDVLARTQPDLLLDLSAPLVLPYKAQPPNTGPVRLEEGSIDVINANNVLEHVADLPALMGNCLRLLKTAGEFRIEVPYEHAPTAWQDPTHVRAMNENSWIYYTEWFWYLGWFEHRFHVERSSYLDLQLKECAREGAAFMRLVLRKVDTTLSERTVARTLQAELRLPMDAVEPRHMYRPRSAAAVGTAASGSRAIAASLAASVAASSPHPSPHPSPHKGRFMIITRTPFRISFFGGGTDYPTWAAAHGGEVLSTTIDKYCYITCRQLPPFFDYKHRIVYSAIENVRHWDEIKHPAVRGVLGWANPTKGLEIHHDGDLPARSGLGSSSSFTVGLVHALAAMKGSYVSKDQLARDAIHIEQDIIGENVGSQDQIAAAYGGFNRIEFMRSGAFQVSPVIVKKQRLKELQKHLMLCFTGFSRIASEVAGAQIANLKNREAELTRMRGMVEEAVKILHHCKRPIEEFGDLLHQAWLCKKQLSDKVSTDEIDQIYQTARDAGAIGGKILGAGGGGFMLLFVKPENQPAVREALSQLIHVPFSFDESGSRVVLYQPNGLC